MSISGRRFGHASPPKPSHDRIVDGDLQQVRGDANVDESLQRKALRADPQGSGAMIERQFG